MACVSPAHRVASFLQMRRNGAQDSGFPGVPVQGWQGPRGSVVASAAPDL